jgi:hypothetical protein
LIKKYFTFGAPKTGAPFKKKYMKKITIVICILLSLTTIMCKSNSSNHSHIGKIDTVRLLLTYYSYFHDTIQYGIGFKIMKDTVRFVNTDSTTKKLKQIVDKIYYVPEFDTVRKDGIPVIDSVTKKVHMEQKYVPTDSRLIIAELNIDLDSLEKTDPYWKKRLHDIRSGKE